MNHSMEKIVDDVFQHTYYDPGQNLREQVYDDEKVLDIIFNLEEQMEQDQLSVEEKLFATNSLGNLYRIINKPDESIHYHSENLRLLSDNERRQVKSFINLAVSYIYANEYKKALLCFEKAETIINRHGYDRYTGALEYQRGKCYMEMRHYNWARAAFDDARSLAIQNSDPVLAGSASKALEYCDDKINAQV
ncbi:tetratricopeptide repeat protein [Salinicoccus carnicancri]|uniref:tetratricopeptide repeat protein n=1 Tax=Salinicoccus carnicancri TaxID=558170 RepID=UPI00031D00AF|nr:tetratricopeptide repeat protein [Salinicoccus carnicancri]